ncbi:hypothetical protein KUTeg_002284 [Tegillarca granosa]|uniref:PCNA-associated factor n=1 Tax=Tegillarca granosa TaxID=220873 RepID=A0ABQ9FXG6_TEGGR|nr:hypothetical protein KUTeg_002284 [Tegillarca granosa]
MNKPIINLILLSHQVKHLSMQVVNPVCPRPTPEWQKGIGSFFQSPNKGKENSEPTPLADEEESEPGCSSSSQNSEMEAGRAPLVTTQMYVYTPVKLFNSTQKNNSNQN